MAVSAQMQATVARLLGREPRGLQDVPVLDAAGGPRVIRVASLVDDKPFPTLYWLVDPELCYRLDQAEAGGLIAGLQQRIDADCDLQAAMREDHERYIAMRENFMSAADRARIGKLGYTDVFASKGIGGIADFTRIRCLHTWYAAHLVVPNTVGALVDRTVLG